MGIVTSDDVAVALGRPISNDDERAQIEWWITSAETQIKARLGDLTLLDQDVLAFVEIEAVAHRASNPEGYTSGAVDDFQFGLPADSRRVTILDEWWHMLGPDTGSGVFSARPQFEPDYPTDFVWPWT